MGAMAALLALKGGGLRFFGQQNVDYQHFLAISANARKCLQLLNYI